MKNNLKLIFYTLIVFIIGSVVGLLCLNTGYDIRDQSLPLGQLNKWIVIGYILMGPGLLSEWLIGYLTSANRITDTVSFSLISIIFQFLVYLTFAFTLHWIGSNFGFGLRVKIFFQKKNVKIARRLILCLLIVIFGLYLYLTSGAVSGKRWLNRSWLVLKNGSCEETFKYVSRSIAGDLRKVKKIALGEKTVKINKYDCDIITISNDLKRSMSKEQIGDLQPIDIFCWCRKHYEDFFQDDIEFSYYFAGKGGYRYKVKRKGETIGIVTIDRASMKKWFLRWANQKCNE